jgi:actin-related protein 6
MPRAKAAPRSIENNPTFVLDNGGFTIKAGFSTSPPTATDCAVIPNCIAYSARDKLTYVGSQLDTCGDFGELAFRRPVQKGVVASWESEKAIWEWEFFDGTGRLKV